MQVTVEEVARALFDWAHRRAYQAPSADAQREAMEGKWLSEREMFGKLARERMAALDASGLVIVRRWDE